MAMMERGKFDTIMFPVNYATWNAGNFGPQVLAKAQQKGMGILALKAMLKRPWPRGADRSAAPNCWYEPMLDPQEALLGLRFTLSHPVTSALHPAVPACFRLALELTPKFTPLMPMSAAQNFCRMMRRAIMVNSSGSCTGSVPSFFWKTSLI